MVRPAFQCLTVYTFQQHVQNIQQKKITFRKNKCIFAFKILNEMHPLKQEISNIINHLHPFGDTSPVSVTFHFDKSFFSNQSLIKTLKT